MRRLRGQRGWSQARLAEAAGTAQPAVARFEGGGTVPGLRVLARLAGALDADLTVAVTARPTLAHPGLTAPSRGRGCGGGRG